MAGWLERCLPRRPVSRALLAGLLLACHFACHAAPPRAAVNSPLGVVRADDPAVAERVAAAAERAVPELRRLLPGLQERKLEVWVQRSVELKQGAPYPAHIAGMADAARSRIHLRESASGMELHLVHELVHLLLDDSWSALPGALEEGLCDLAAALLAGAEGRAHHAKRLLEAAASLDGFEVVVDVEWPHRRGTGRRHGATVFSHRLRLAFDEARRPAARDLLALGDEQVFKLATGDQGVGLYGVGYLVVLELVERLSLDGLHRLCMRATGDRGLEVERILAACGVAPNGAGLGSLAREQLERLEPRLLAEALAESLAKALAASRPAPFQSAEQLLERGRPTLRHPGGGAQVALAEIASFRAALLLAWREAEAARAGE